jgi:LmbE family N-acetylglucosaminyl deacetylase
MAGGTLYRAAHDGNTRIEVIYVTAGDALIIPGPCREESEEARRQKIVALREEETRAACRVLGIGPSHLHFLRYPDQGLVAESSFSNGQRVDVLTEAGERAMAQVTDLLPRLVPSNASNLQVITASFWDAHPDHRTIYQAARAASEVVSSQRNIPVTILHAIVHDESPFPFPICCPGDLFWPNNGPHLDHDALADNPERPRPPPWDRIYDVADVTTIRVEAMNEHVSQFTGYPELCMFVLLKRFYKGWLEKTQEAFWEETL